MTSEKPRIVNCPQCGKPTPWDLANPHRPFCSQRCRLIDLGQWASESYRIAPAQNQSEPNEE